MHQRRAEKFGSNYCKSRPCCSSLKLCSIFNLNSRRNSHWTLFVLQSTFTQMQHLLSSKCNVSQQWEQRHEIHRSPRPNKSSIEGDEGEQQAVAVIMQRMREQEQMEPDESEPPFVITRADTNASWRTALAQRCIQMSWLPLKCDLIMQPAGDLFLQCNLTSVDHLSLS